MSDSNAPTPTAQQRAHEDAQDAAARAISPRAARLGWTPQECSAFAEMDAGAWYDVDQGADE